LNAWLYPVSRDGTHAFRDARGKRRPVSFDGIRSAADAGTLPSRLEWTCVQNGANVEPGDALYVYQGDVGIFCAGHVEDARPSTKTTAGGAPMWIVEWRVDADRTRHLLETPVPADLVRKHVHPRVTVRNFTKGARALRRRLTV
jgi:hypothetical protein